LDLEMAIKDRDIETLKALRVSQSDSCVRDVAGYHLSILENLEVNSILYSELSTLYNAYRYIKDGDVESGRSQLELIGADSKSQIYLSYAQYISKGYYMGVEGASFFR